MSKKSSIVMTCLVILFFVAGCEKKEGLQAPAGELTDSQVENIVLRSYQYVALYNVINKSTMDPKNPAMTGWNNCVADTTLKDHNLKVIARPNNDTLYITCSLDLRKDPLILDVPAFSSKHVFLMTFTYDHYVNVPLTTRTGDFQKPEKFLFYSVFPPSRS